jgi:hypothetical protein
MKPKNKLNDLRTRFANKLLSLKEQQQLKGGQKRVSDSSLQYISSNNPRKNHSNTQGIGVQQVETIDHLRQDFQK